MGTADSRGAAACAKCHEFDFPGPPLERAVFVLVESFDDSAETHGEVVFGISACMNPAKLAAMSRRHGPSRLSGLEDVEA